DRATKLLRLVLDDPTPDWPEFDRRLQSAGRAKAMKELKETWVLSCERFAQSMQEQWRNDSEFRSTVGDDQQLASLIHGRRNYGVWAHKTHNMFVPTTWLPA